MQFRLPFASMTSPTATCNLNCIFASKFHKFPTIQQFLGDDSGNGSIEKGSKDDSKDDAKDDSKEVLTEESTSAAMDPVEKIRLFLEEKLGLGGSETVDLGAVQVKMQINTAPIS